MYKQTLSHLPILTDLSCSCLPWLCEKSLAPKFGLCCSLQVFLACAVHLRHSAPPEKSASKRLQFHVSMSGDWTQAPAHIKKKPLYSSKYRELNLGHRLHSNAKAKKLNGSSDVTEMNRYVVSQGWMLAVSSATRAEAEVMTQKRT